MWHIPEIIFLSKGSPSRFSLWKTAVTGTIVGAILVAALIGNNHMAGNSYKRSMNLFLVALLVMDLWAVWKAARRLRALRRGGG
jgi:hypothetical protein